LRDVPPALDRPALPDDVDVYLVLDDFGERLGRAWRETDEERTDWETMVRGAIHEPGQDRGFQYGRKLVPRCLRGNR
jgi:hypothetical protein